MDQRAILAAVNNSAPVGAKGFWWNIADLSSILQLGTRDAEFLMTRREAWFWGATKYPLHTVGLTDFDWS